MFDSCHSDLVFSLGGRLAGCNVTLIIGKPRDSGGCMSLSYVLVGGTGRPAWFRSMFTKVGASSSLAEDIPYCLLEEQQTRKTKNLVRVKPRMGANPIEATNGRFV